MDGYATDAADKPPLAAYAAMMTLFAGTFGTMLVRASLRNTLPSTVGTRDMVVLALATHSLSHILTRDRVTSVLRSPFTKYEGTSGAGEVRESARGGGLRRAVGTLLTCEYCADPWVASALTAGLIFRPRPVRVATSVLAIVAMSDFLHQAYAFARRPTSD